MQDFSKVKIAEVMTKSPRCIELHQPIELARSWMDELKVRHLPARESGRIVGILSDRDLQSVSASGSRVQAHEATVEDAMISSILTVLDSQTVSDVAKTMMSHRVGSVIVNGADGMLKGVFTDTDALKILSGQI